MPSIKLIGLSNGEDTQFDGKFVKLYDPHYCPDGEQYDGGKLEVTPNRDEALEFPDAKAAIEYWRQSHGIRPDGKPNRPLTAFSVEIG